MEAMSLKGEQHYYTLGMVCLFITKTGFNFINFSFIFYRPLKLLRVKILCFDQMNQD